MSMWDKSYCSTDCDQRDCERNIKYNKPTEQYYSVTTFDTLDSNGELKTDHTECIWKERITVKELNKKERKELQKLRAKVNDQEEQLKNFIPRRRVRRVYKTLGNILDADVDNLEYVKLLKDFINKIEKEGKAEAGPDVKTAIERLLSVRER